jgi:putative FmdB family regulatory protein
MVRGRYPAPWRAKPIDWERPMPVYDYLCGRCGPFTDIRPMAECEQPSQCPRCGRKAQRAFLTAPYFAALPAERRLAHATNERSAHAPSTLSDMKKAHGVGCHCCTRKSMGNAGRAKNSGKNRNKTFPGSRPWMISH